MQLHSACIVCLAGSAGACTGICLHRVPACSSGSSAICQQAHDAPGVVSSPGGELLHVLQ